MRQPRQTFRPAVVFLVRQQLASVQSSHARREVARFSTGLLLDLHREQVTVG
jgi:hypothetical protein